ncbi:MAG TPA: MAB_1171c family putative transporter [Actinoplanes sp.]|nr:MAB_1171c family putative transporter [Actinoplanes sp.]
MVVVGLILLVSGLLKIRSMRPRPNAYAPRALCIGLLAFGLSFLLLAPPHPAMVSEALHLHNGGRLLGNLLTLVSAGAMQVMMLYLAHPVQAARPRARRRLAVIGAVAVAMTLLMLSADTQDGPNFVERYATYTPITVYLLLYLSCLVVAEVDLIHLSVKYSRHVGSMLRIGLRMVAVGGALFVVHTAYKISIIVLAWAGAPLPGNETAVTTGLAAAGGVLVAAGTTLPVWGPPVLLPWRSVRQHRAHRRLAPLWRALTAAIPEVMLTRDDEAADEARPWTIDLRLYRRVIEIRDAQLLLQPYGDPCDVGRAQQEADRAGLRGERAQAFVEAATVHSALARWRSAGPPAAPPVPPRRSVGDASLSREIRYLERVAAAFNALDAEQDTSAVR